MKEGVKIFFLYLEQTVTFINICLLLTQEPAVRCNKNKFQPVTTFVNEPEALYANVDHNHFRMFIQG